MKTVRIALLLSCAVLVASPLHAATIRIDAFAEYAFDTATSGPPAVPLIADAEGNVLNPTAGQSYAILLTISVSDLGTLPNGKSEKGLASMHFDVNLQGLFENSRLPGWNLAQQNVDLNGSPPGGCCVPLWLDLCDCGFGGSLENISVGVDVPDFQIGNNNFDLRQTVGQGDPWGLGHVYADYRGGGARMDITIDSFEVHDLEATYPGIGLALGDSVLFVPEPGSGITAMIAAIVAVLGGVFQRRRGTKEGVTKRTTNGSSVRRACCLERCEDRRLLAAILELSGSPQLAAQPPLNVSTFSSGGGPLLPENTYQDEMEFTVNPANPLMIAGATHRIVANPQEPGNPTLTTIDVLFSNDGGTTWSNTAIDDVAEISLDDPNATEVILVRGDPVIEFDSAGNLYVAYLRALTKNTLPKSDLVIAARAPGGSAFSQFRIIEQVDGEVAGYSDMHQPRLAVGRDGSDLTKESLYVIYNRFVSNTVAVRISGSNDLQLAAGHLVFTQPATLNDGALSAPPKDRFPDVSVGPLGDVHVTWHTHTEIG